MFSLTEHVSIHVFAAQALSASLLACIALLLQFDDRLVHCVHIVIYVFGFHCKTVLQSLQCHFTCVHELSLACVSCFLLRMSSSMRYESVLSTRTHSLLHCDPSGLYVVQREYMAGGIAGADSRGSLILPGGPKLKQPCMLTCDRQSGSWPSICRCPAGMPCPALPCPVLSCPALQRLSCCYGDTEYCILNAMMVQVGHCCGRQVHLHRLSQLQSRGVRWGMQPVPPVKSRCW